MRVQLVQPGSLPVYLVNLERSPDRLAEMDRQLAGLALPYQRVVAVDGRHLSMADQRRWCPHPGRTYRLGPGEIGCFLSHRACWRTIARSDDPFAVILEDDIDLAPAARDLFASAEWIPRDADIVKLETRIKGTTLLDKQALFVDAMHRTARLRGYHTGSAGYIIRREAARRLLAMTDTFTDAVDQFLFNPDLPAFETLIIYQLVPAVCAQHKWIARCRDGAWGPPSELDIERAGLRPKRTVWQQGGRAIGKAVSAIATHVAPATFPTATNAERQPVPFG